MLQMNFDQIKEIYFDKSADYVCTLGEIKTDLELYAERLRGLGKPFIANKVDTIGAILECAIGHAEALVKPDVWESESKVS